MLSSHKGVVSLSGWLRCQSWCIASLAALKHHCLRHAEEVPSKILGVRNLRFLVLRADMFLMGHAHSCCEGCGCVCTWIDQCCIYPRWVRDEDAVLLLWYDACKVPVSFPLGEMGGLQYGEGSTEFILMGVDGFGSYYTRDLHYGVFLGSKYFVCPILG